MNLILIYFLLQLAYVIAATIVYSTDKDNRFPFIDTANDRIWWKYTKLFVYWYLFWGFHIPWFIMENTKFRLLFKKD